MRFSNHALVALYVTLLTFPAVNMALGVVKEDNLGGAVEEVKRPPLKREEFVAERYQKDFTTFFDAHYGLKSYLVKFDNSLTFYAFGETKVESGVRVGKMHTLYGSDDIAYFNRTAAA